MHRTAPTPHWHRTLVVLTSAVVPAIVILACYWARMVLIPLALAIFLTFLLTPLVKALRRVGLGRVPGVLLVILMAGSVIAGVVWATTHQVSAFVQNLPQFAPNIRTKVADLRALMGGDERLGISFDEMSDLLQGRTVAQDTDGTVLAAPLIIQAERSSWFRSLTPWFGSSVEFLGVFALALILAVFMLINQEDLRNRVIRLIGSENLTSTTEAVDEVGHRIMRYLIVQAVLNATFGLILGIALFVIGVQHALLWGLLAAVLRYVPYLGAWLTAGLLFTISLAMFDGWLRPLLVFGIIAALEIIISQLLEPWLFGRSFGTTEVALLTSAAFWTFLWGPIGLLLSGPLTVCLAVLGRHVPRLGFLDVMLGDEPALGPEMSYYQRLLARDQDEAAALALMKCEHTPLERLYDEMLIPALCHARRDRQREAISESLDQFIRDATREISEDLGECRSTTLIGSGHELGAAAHNAAPIRLLGWPGGNETDEVALQMLRHLLDPKQWQLEVLQAERLKGEAIQSAQQTQVSIVCIAALPPGGLAHTRLLCKRLRANLPNARILVGRWGLRGKVEENVNQLLAAGADEVQITLASTRDALLAWLPNLQMDAGRQYRAAGLPSAIG